MELTISGRWPTANGLDTDNSLITVTLTMANGSTIFLTAKARRPFLMVIHFKVVFFKGYDQAVECIPGQVALTFASRDILMAICLDRRAF